MLWFLECLFLLLLLFLRLDDAVTEQQQYVVSAAELAGNERQGMDGSYG